MKGQLKDYYRILEISAAATQADVKKAYRRLALKYHPDKSTDNSFAVAMFHDVQEAYSTLADADRRRRYDEERWLSGMTSRSLGQQITTPEWILQECRKLQTHMALIDTYRMDHSALYEYVAILLSDAHMAVLQNGPVDTQHSIVRLILSSTKHIRHPYMEMIAQKLGILSGNDNELIAVIDRQKELSKKDAEIGKYTPWLVVLATLGLCILMYLWHKHSNQ